MGSRGRAHTGRAHTGPAGRPRPRQTSAPCSSCSSPADRARPLFGTGVLTRPSQLACWYTHSHPPPCLSPRAAGAPTGPDNSPAPHSAPRHPAGAPPRLTFAAELAAEARVAAVAAHLAGSQHGAEAAVGTGVACWRAQRVGCSAAQALAAQQRGGPLAQLQVGQEAAEGRLVNPTSFLLTINIQYCGM